MDFTERRSLSSLLRVREINLLAIIGGVLALIGLFIPWFNITIYARHGWDPIYTIPVQLTPLFMKTEIQGKMETQWFQINLGSNLIGAICITCSILGLVEGITNKQKFSWIGGILTIFAPFIFLSCLPRQDTYIFFGPGGILTALGGVLMFFSLIVEISMRDIFKSARAIVSFVQSFLLS